MSKQIVLACAGLNPDKKAPLCERHDECAHYEEWWSVSAGRQFAMNLCTQAGEAFKMFTPWRDLVRAGTPVEFKLRSALGELFA